MTDSRQPWVLLYHQVDDLLISSGGLGRRGDHYDLMLSPPGAGWLWTWAIPVNPVRQELPLECGAERLSDHRRIYLDYQGLISDERGHVQQAAKGTCEILAWSEQQVKARLWLDEATGHEESFLISLTRQSGIWHLSWSEFAVPPSGGISC